MEKHREPAYGLIEAAKECMSVEWSRDDKKKDKTPTTFDALSWLKNPLNSLRATAKLTTHKNANLPEDHTV